MWRRRAARPPRFLVVAVGQKYEKRCVDSIRAQEGVDLACSIVVDADPTAGEFLTWADPRFSYWFTQDRRFALANQVSAWRSMDPQDDDVVVFVDLDDRLARPDALAIVRSYYDQGALMTYGSYRAVPPDHPTAASCKPARPYPDIVHHMNTYRRIPAHFNHLRTVQWRVLKHLTDKDLRNDQGEYWVAHTDSAIMIPCLELAGTRCAVIPDVLYEYTCDNPASVWRSMNDTLRQEYAQLQARPAKARLREAL